MILVLGGTGQIGHEVARELSALGTVVAPTRQELDLASPTATREFIGRVGPMLVVNAAAYTMVDQAESEPDACAQLNTDLPALLAEACRALGSSLVHFSTDYVFDGSKRTPYVESDEPHPLGVYGRTKYEGEKAVASVGGAYLIVRTSWIYGVRGRNFPATILRLAREREELAVVDDQVGAPTSAQAVAAGVAEMVRALGRSTNLRDAVEAASGIYHMTASGSTTWFEFARTILAADPRAIEHVCRSVRPIGTAEFPLPAARPANSLLDNTKVATAFDVHLPSWMEQWRAVADQLRLRPHPALPSRGIGEHVV